MVSFIVMATRLAGLVSAIVLLMIVLGGIKYDGSTVLVSCIGVGLWAWCEYDERKAAGK